MDVRQFADKMNELYRAAKTGNQPESFACIGRLEPIGTGRMGRCAGAYYPAVRTAAEGHQQGTGRNAAPSCANAELQRGRSDGESSIAEF